MPLSFKPFKILGVSPAIEQMRKEIEKAAPTDARILITGENGSGKELVAEAIHRNSRRTDRPFLKINCAAIPKTLIESELFGYEKGAFTGAYERKTGLIEEADGGTLLLDEIGDLSLEMQAKLLRVLQEYEFVRVGGTQPIAFDVRVISATNKNLRKAIQEGRFRSDLFFRLNVIPIAVPPLRDRPEDIELLAKHFLKKAGRAKGEKEKLTSDAIELLISYRWPGNVRELRNAMERAAIMIGKDEVSAADLKNIMPDLANAPSGKGQFSLLDGKSLREKIDDYERHILSEAYQHSKGNVSRMARLLKTDRANLHRKLARYGIR
jgi:two-component system nitrogen regulation response regulator NtrX